MRIERAQTYRAPDKVQTPMKVLITGSEGQIARSIRAVAVDREDLELVFASRPTFDLGDPATVRATIVEAAPDVVINAAA